MRPHFFFTRWVSAVFNASSAWISAMRMPLEFLYTSAVRSSLQEGWVALIQLSLPKRFCASSGAPTNSSWLRYTSSMWRSRLP